MANLPETPTWEAGIYQFERTDPVEGGPDGIDNTPGKQLANRTAYLKQEVELRAPIASPAFTGHPTAPTQAPGNNSTRLANTAFVQAALAALVDSSPAALDTLNELAAALGDDPNFAATVTAALAAKAPLASPALTGEPTAPTQSAADDSTKLATTAFVQAVAAAAIADHPGSVKFVVTSAAPVGYLKANGAAVSRTTYAALFSAIGTTFGAGDGSTTFNLPDLRGEFIRGWDDGRGVDSGRMLGSWQDQLFESHGHTGTALSNGSHSHTGSTNTTGNHNHSQTIATSGGGAGGAVLGFSASGSQTAYNINNDGNHSHSLSINSNGAHTHTLSINETGGSETRPRNVALLAVIKY
ncbi:phage tail protein [Tepidicaulis sp. LMO-SS28]|uniref:phage tail protein n=1 Tax=Tepidicaulis sp. LMO-SS28 TaxID=3447455 RepID=UPI003EDE8F1A